MKRQKNIFNGKLRDSEDEQKGNDVFHKNNKVERSCYAKKSNTKKKVIARTRIKIHREQVNRSE